MKPPNPELFLNLYQVLIILGTAVTVTSILHPFKISPVLGYLVAGILISPYGLGLIDHLESVRHLAEFGVVFLLFAIGLELPIERLKVMRRLVFGLGGLQVAATSLSVGGVAYLILGQGPAAILIGGAMALSSTALVLQLLVERGELSTLYGRAAFSTVLFQDLAVVPLIVAVPLLGMADKPIFSAMGLALANGVLLIAIVFLVGRLLIRPLFSLIDVRTNPELFTAASLLIVLATAALSYTFGLSMALGAFLAGILLAGTAYRHQVSADIQPFRGLLLGLFFMTVGMTINIQVIVAEFGTVVALVVAIVVAKGAVMYGLARAFGKSPSTAARYGVMLSQGGEFAFVLLGLAVEQEVLDSAHAQLLFAVVALSMMLTPVLVRVLFPKFDQWEKPVDTGTQDSPHSADRSGHVIIAGYGRVGRTVGRVLDAEGTPFVAIDLDHIRVTKSRARGRPVFYGDALRIPVWRAVGAGEAKAVVVATSKPVVVSKIVSLLRQEFPHLKIFVRAADNAHAKELQEAGATESIPITFQASLELGASVLKSMGQAAEEVSEVVEYLRNRYDDDGTPPPTG